MDSSGSQVTYFRNFDFDSGTKIDSNLISPYKK